jgi:hypothetical protein
MEEHMNENTNYFEDLYKVNCNDKIEKKNGLSYLAWAFAWAEIKKRHPDAFYTIYENKEGWFYHTDGKTCWVKTGVTVNGLEHIEYLPVMDFRNQSIPADKVTSFDVNKAIQRSLTKACARHGLGLYVYAGEDLPEQPFEPMTEQQRTRLEELGANWDKLLPYLKVSSLEEISADMADKLIKAKEAKMQETL